MKTFTLALLVALAGPAAGTADPATVTAEVNTRWEAAFAAGDAATLATLYAADATVVSPGLEIVNSAAEIEKFWAAKIGSGTREFRVQSINLRVEGDRVYQTAAWSAGLLVKGRLNRFDGEMTNVLARQPDGSWKIQLQNWH